MSPKQQDIQKLTPHIHTRVRTEMYLGSRGLHNQLTLLHTDQGPFVLPVTWVPALMTSFREIIDNSLDELTKGKIRNGELRISYDESTMHFVIEDNGRGIPIDWNNEEQMHVVTMALTELMAGDNFSDADRQGTAGMNGVGGSTVAHVSSFMNVTVVRAGRPYNDFIDETRDYTIEELNEIEENSKLNEYSGFYEFTQTYTEDGVDDRDREALLITDPDIKKTKKTKTGTRIEFALSPDVFHNMQLPSALVESLVREIAATNSHLKIYFNDELMPSGKTAISVLFPEAKNYIEHNIRVDGFVADFFVIPGTIEEGTLQHGLVNNIPMFKGGKHIQAFKDKFALGLIKALGKESKKRKLTPNRADVEEGTLMYHVTKMDGPFFNGQEKTELTNDFVYKLVEGSMDDKFFETVIRKNSKWIDDIYERTAARTNKKDADAVNREAKKNLRKKVAKLDDAHYAGKNNKKQDTILFLTEGDSASGFGDVKDNNLHGILPLRGKILNVSDSKTTYKSILDSQSTADIMNALGLIPGEKAVRSELRYGSVCIATDMDHDGANIAALIINFLYKYWPELFDDSENPFVYIFMTPFIICYKDKQRSYFYLDDYDQFKPEDWKGWGIRRAKGLGTLQRQDFIEAFKNLRVIPVVDDENLPKVLDLIFNKSRADDRKEWMMESGD